MIRIILKILFNYFIYWIVLYQLCNINKVYNDILSNVWMRNSIFSLETIEYSPLYKIKRNFMFVTQSAGKKIYFALNKIFGAIKSWLLSKKKLFALILVNNEFNKKNYNWKWLYKGPNLKISVLLRKKSLLSSFFFIFYVFRQSIIWLLFFGIFIVAFCRKLVGFYL